MRPLSFSALIFLLSASFVCAAETKAAEPAAPKSGTRSGSTESSKTEGTRSKRPVSQKPAPAQTSEKPKTEDERFAAARKAAAEDPKVMELREKADAAKNDESSARLMRSYLRTLYGRMRTLEPSLEERINMTEAAALKAVGKAE